MKEASWFTFIGTTVLLVGIFATVHTVVNFALPRYPQSGVLSINMGGYTPTIQRESDCDYNHPYYAEDGKTLREPTENEKMLDEKDKTRCLRGIEEVRNEVRIADISESLLFLFVGIGLLNFPKFFKK